MARCSPGRSRPPISALPSRPFSEPSHPQSSPCLTPSLNICRRVPLACPATEESFPSATGLTFDPIDAAESAADFTLALVFNPQRANRLVEYHAQDSAEPSLTDVIDATLKSTGSPDSFSGLQLQVKYAVDERILEALLALGANPESSAMTRATVRAAVASLREQLRTSGSQQDAAFHQLETSRIDQFLNDPAKFVPAQPIPAPPGMPIGDDADE